MVCASWGPLHYQEDKREKKNTSLSLEMSGLRYAVCSLRVFKCRRLCCTLLHLSLSVSCHMYTHFPICWSLVSRYTLQAHGFGFPHRLFPSSVNHTSLSPVLYLSFITESQTQNIFHYSRSWVMAIWILHIRKWPPPSSSSSLAGQSRETSTDRLVPHSHSYLSSHQSLVSMYSMFTLWFTWLLIISSHVAAD